MRVLQAFESCPMGFGGASISGEGAGYGFGAMDEKTAINLLHEARDLGVKLFDTAPIYGFGLSEERFGKAFKKSRQDVFYVSKSGVTWSPMKRVDMTNDPKTTLSMLETSLRTLQTDYIDLYMIHWPDAKVDIRRPMEVLVKAQREGKIKSIGLCNTNQKEIELAEEIGVIRAVQNQLNLFERADVDVFLPWLKQKGISYMSWGTLDKGILTGRVDRERKFDQQDCRSWAPWWKAINFEERFQFVERLKPLMSEREITGVELAIGHNLAVDGVDMVLCGARTSEQLKGCLSSLKPLDSKLMQQVLEIGKSYYDSLSKSV